MRKKCECCLQLTSNNILKAINVFAYARRPGEAARCAPRSLLSLRDNPCPLASSPAAQTSIAFRIILTLLVKLGRSEIK